VGYFIGSPGMNVLDAQVEGNTARIGGQAVALGAGYDPLSGRTQIGIRPEFVDFTDSADGLPVTVTAVEDVGRHRIVRATLDGTAISAVLAEDAPLPADSPRVLFRPERIGVFENDWRIAPASGGTA